MPPRPAGTKRCSTCSATSSTSSNGASTTAIRCRNGATAGSRCSATPRTRPCRPWRKAPTWRSRTVLCWRGFVAPRRRFETALQAYPAERKPRTDWVTLKSREQFANNTKASPPPFVDRTWLFVNDVVREEGALRRRDARSVRLDIGGLDHLSPTSRFRRRRACRNRQASRGKARSLDPRAAPSTPDRQGRR